jgi:hypothetical protein
VGVIGSKGFFAPKITYFVTYLPGKNSLAEKLLSFQVLPNGSETITDD